MRIDRVNKYEKLPVVIEAVQLTEYNSGICTDFINGGYKDWDKTKNGIGPDGKFHINTLEGDMIAGIGDYIIKGINGEFYPCKPDIFEKTYKLVK